MGGLAKWGAVAGGAKGWQKNIEHERKIELDDLDMQREERLKALEDKFARGRDTQRQTHEKDLLGQRGEQTQTLQSNKQTFETGESEKQRQFDAEQAEKDRMSSEKIAGIKAASSGKSSAYDRWSAKTTTQTRTGENGIPEQYDSVALFDNETGRTYLQEGQRFIPQGTAAASVRRAPREAINDLLSDPLRADQFLEAYGYLPIEFFGAAQGGGQGGTISQGQAAQVAPQ